ncbi:MAG: hypothetical protein ACTHJW_20190 [Streptosporangiaceae bacterium]
MAVAVGGCTGDAAWVIVSEDDRYGQPTERDLLHTTNLGATWLDVLHWTRSSGPRPAVPHVPSPPGGSRRVPNLLAPYITWLAAPAPDTAWVALADDNEQHTGFGVTADGGLTWHFWTFRQPQSEHAVPAAHSDGLAGLEYVTAVDDRHAFILASDPTHKSRRLLYATSDGGSTWSNIAVFRTGLPPPN